MKRLALILALILTALTMFTGRADVLDTAPSCLRKVYAGYYHMPNPGNINNGDSLIMIVMNPMIIYPNERFRNRKDEEFYWKTVRDVRRTLPYAKLIGATLLETYEYIETYDSQKEKQAYLTRFEKEIFNQYKPVMKKMTKRQGKILIKLINRETNQSSYSVIKAFLGTFRAGFWQTFGRFFGVNLKTGYHPEKNNEDAMIERICCRLEQGAL